MSTYQVLDGVSRMLHAMLWDAFRRDPEVKQYVGGESAIVFSNPVHDHSKKASGLSVWLYKVDEDAHSRNVPRMRQADGDGDLGPPLSLVLNYLMTPLVQQEGELLVLGKLLETMHEHPLLQAAPDLHVHEDLRISLHQRSLEELTRIWDALQAPYRLSVCYQVRVGQIQGRPRRGAGVVRRREVEAGP